MSESTYDRKRSFETTPEPPGEHVGDVDPLAAPVGPGFVVQQHHATALRRDVRLEMNIGGVPVLVFGVFSRRAFPGGGGSGTTRWSGAPTTASPSASSAARLAGMWHPVHTAPMNGKDGWLAIMSEDERGDPESWPEAEPMQATPSDQPDDEEGWGYEPKWPGLRVLARCTDETHLFDSAGEEITDTFPDLGRLHDRVVALDAMVDGVVLAFDDGRPSPERLEEVLDRDSGGPTPIAYLLFDLLYLDGKDITDRPLRERRELLEELTVPSDKVQLSPLTEGNATALVSAVAEQGFEGVVAKRLDSRYQPGATTEDWLALPTPG